MGKPHVLLESYLFTQYCGDFTYHSYVDKRTEGSCMCMQGSHNSFYLLKNENKSTQSGYACTFGSPHLNLIW